MQPSVESVLDDAAVDALALTGFVVIDGWLGDDGAASLERDVVRLLERGCFAPSRIGGEHDRHEASGIRRDSVCWFDEHARPDARDGRVGVLPGGEVSVFLARMGLLREHLNRTCFLALENVECHASCYEKGAFYGAHLDNAAGQSRSVISFVHYLSARTAEESGGCLRLHVAGGDSVDIAPMRDRLVIFRSREMLHEVLPVTVQRLSMTGWMSGRDCRPPRTCRASA